MAAVWRGFETLGSTGACQRAPYVCIRTRNPLHECCFKQASSSLQVFNGVRLSDRMKPLLVEGVSNGAHLIMLRKRSQAPQPSAPAPARPSLAEVEAAIRREAERQGVEVQAAAPVQRARNRGAFEARLQSIMNVRLFLCCTLHPIIEWNCACCSPANVGHTHARASAHLSEGTLLVTLDVVTMTTSPPLPHTGVARRARWHD